MRVRLDTVLKDINDKPISDPQEPGAFTVERALIGALLAQNPRENPDGAEKFKRWELARKMRGLTEVTVTVEEAALLKKLVGEAYSATVVGQVWTLLEQPETERKLREAK